MDHARGIETGPIHPRDGDCRRRRDRRKMDAGHDRPQSAVIDGRRRLPTVAAIGPPSCVTPLLGVLVVLMVSPAAVAQQWLIEANQRIEEFRMGDLTVRVVDPREHAVEGANVQAIMRRHAFKFGTAVTAGWINRAGATGDTYREKLLENFNSVVLENDLKWPAWVGLWGESLNWPNTERALDWLDAHDLPTRGHYLSWATWSGFDAYGTSDDLATLPTRLRNHITDKATTVGNRVTDWDVINHPVGWGLPTYEDHLGIDFYQEIVDHARSVAPDGMPMWINEDNITTGEWSDDYQRIIEYLIENGSPPDGIGIQGHINQSWGRIRTPEEVYAQLDRMADVIPRLKVTEFDVNTPGNDDYQAQLLHDYLVTFFSHPAMEEVLMWGFWGEAHWLGDDAALYRSDWTEKPALAAYQDLVFNQWWSEEEGVTNSVGELNVRGFLGDYEIVVDYDGGQRIVPLNLEPGSNLLTVVVPDPSSIVLGDVNHDGEVNGLDVDPFVDVLLGGLYQPAADMNEDHDVNGLDVDAFVVTILGGGTHQIPEPPTLLLAIVALGVVGGWRKWAVGPLGGERQEEGCSSVGDLLHSPPGTIA